MSSPLETMETTLNRVPIWLVVVFGVFIGVHLRGRK